MASTLIITIVSDMSVADVTNQLLGVGTITAQPLAQDRVARLIDGIATGAFPMTSVVTAVS